VSDAQKPGLRVDVAALVARGEDERIEFKKSLSERDKGLQTLAAMASQDGGTLVFGISPQGKPVGVTIGENTLESLGQAIRTGIEPTIYPSIDFGQYEGVIVITVTVRPTGELHTWAGRLYHRMGRETDRVDPAEFRRRLLRDRATHGAPVQSTPAATPGLKLFYEPDRPPFRQVYPDDGPSRELVRIGVRTASDLASISDVRVRVEDYAGSPDVYIDTVEHLEFMGGTFPFGQDVHPGHPLYAEFLLLLPSSRAVLPDVRVHYANINRSATLQQPLPAGQWDLAVIATGRGVPPDRRRFRLTIRDDPDDRVKLHMLD
jgi:hypothetical protein